MRCRKVRHARDPDGDRGTRERGSVEMACLMMLGLWALQFWHCRVGMRARKSEMSSDMASDIALVSSLARLDSAQMTNKRHTLLQLRDLWRPCNHATGSEAASFLEPSL